ncbi:hypothetical protein D3C76_1329940 [compost metagenome]
MISTFGWRSSTLPSAANSSRVKIAPLGLFGEFSITQRVRGLMAASNCSGVTLKPCTAPQGMTTGTPPLSMAISVYDTQYGAGVITSSPGSRVARKALNSSCLAPLPTQISSRP